MADKTAIHTCYLLLQEHERQQEEASVGILQRRSSTRLCVYQDKHLQTPPLMVRFALTSAFAVSFNLQLSLRSSTSGIINLKFLCSNKSNIEEFEFKTMKVGDSKNQRFSFLL